jgi:polysaccharide lyase-like protein
MPGSTRIALLVATLALAGAGAGEADAVILKRLDYETGNFGQWTAVQAVAGGARIVTSPVRQGRFAARFIVRPGDDPINATGERAEVYTPTSESEGSESWWAWSTYFPTGFRPNRNTDWNIFTQWHQTGNRCSPPVSFEIATYSSPARLRLRVWGGRLATNCDSTSRRTWNFATLRRNRWYNFTFHVKWSSKASVGFVQLWLNGKQVIPKRYVATLYAGMGVYIKQGFYRAHSSLTTTLYHDGLRRYRP